MLLVDTVMSTEKRGYSLEIMVPFQENILAVVDTKTSPL